MKKIFEPVKINNLTFKNRLLRSATWEGIANPDGSVTEQAYQIYEELAKGGVGAIITGFTSVARNDRYFGGMMRLCDDALIPQYQKLTNLIHAEGIPVISQLAIGAFYRESRGHGVQVEPDDMTAEEIAWVVRQFTEAARRAQKAGFDGVQIHAAHFFFLSRFISPAVNHRTDAYGGSTVHPLRSISSHEPNQRFGCSLKNRARILLDILSGIREAAPDLHVTIKINCNDFTASGLDEKACLDICQILDKAGIARYCQRLARIYKNEESIGGLPINMENFCLFDENHRSSKPLNLAYEAAKPADHQKADAFLKALRHATVKAGLPTTHFDVILDVVRHSGIDETAFTKHYEDGSADLAYAKLLRVHSLPTYLFQYQGKALFLQSFDYHEFVEAISRLTA